jgi:hypothetical protein
MRPGVRAPSAPPTCIFKILFHINPLTFLVRGFFNSCINIFYATLPANISPHPDVDLMTHKRVQMVWERNSRAIAFYEKWKFRVVGEQAFLLGTDVQKDLLMARPAELLSVK